MPKKFVNWTQEKEIAIVVVDNPPMNVLSLKVAEELLECFQEINAKKDCRALIITGEGEEAFLAGADIKELAGLIESSTSTLPYTQKLHDTLNYLEALPISTLAAINGYALGGGLELAMACDFRIASESALLGMPEIKLGLFPGAGGTQRLSRLVGVSLAKEMIFTGNPITAEKSLRVGLVNEIVSPEKLLDSAKEFALLLTSRPGAALKLVKEVINRGIKVSLEEGCMIERDLLERVFLTEDAREGVQSFLEKREPVFKHR